MLKRCTTLLLALSLLLSLCGCPRSNDDDAPLATPEADGTVAAPAEAARPNEATPPEESGDISFTIFVGGSVDWTPFESGDTEFITDNSSIASAEAKGQSVIISGLTAGEASVTAAQGAAIKTARITVKEYAESTAADGSVAGWLLYFSEELEGRSKDEQMEYLLSIGDYAALSLAAKELDADLVNMAEAAALLYPCSYLLNNYAALRMDLREFNDAVLWLDKALEAAPDDPVILTNLAQCHYELGDCEAAELYASRALASEPDYGLAHLVMTCVHLKNGNQLLAMETLFKSIRTVWTDTSSDLMRDLLRSVREAAGFTSSIGWDYLKTDGCYYELGEMVLTDHHIELLFEAAAAGNVTDGRDTPANQISLPFPLDPSDAASGYAPWGEEHDAVKA